MNCPNCQHKLSRVLDSRADPLLVRRRRVCFSCNQRWTTYEMDTLTIERLKSGSAEFGERAEDILGLLETAMELVNGAKRDATPLLTLHGTRNRSREPRKEHITIQ